MLALRKPHQIRLVRVLQQRNNLKMMRLLGFEI